MNGTHERSVHGIHDLDVHPPSPSKRHQHLNPNQQQQNVHRTHRDVLEEKQRWATMMHMERLEMENDRLKSLNIRKKCCGM